jgi:hypothetical protein
MIFLIYKTNVRSTNNKHSTQFTPKVLAELYDLQGVYTPI